MSTELFEILKNGFFPISDFNKKYACIPLTYDGMQCIDDSEPIRGYRCEFNIEMLYDADIIVIGWELLQGDLCVEDEGITSTKVKFYLFCSSIEHSIEQEFIIQSWDDVDRALKQWPEFVDRILNDFPIIFDKWNLQYTEQPGFNKSNFEFHWKLWHLCWERFSNEYIDGLKQLEVDESWCPYDYLRNNA